MSTTAITPEATDQAASPGAAAAKPQGMVSFLWIWLGQTVSMVGTGVTGFAISVWIYQTTGSVTQFTLAAVLVVLPGIVIGPFCGVLVDRWDRRWAMILADLGAASRIVFLLVLLSADRLELQVWHVYVAAVVRSLFEAVQVPAYMASVPLLVPKSQLGRVNGLIQFSFSASRVVAPAVAGLLLPSIGLGGLLWVDVATFLFALTTLAVVRIPRPPEASAGADDQHPPSVWREATAGWQYLRGRTGLLAVALFVAAVNLVAGSAYVLVTPLLLALGKSATELGLVLSVGSLGMVLGSLVMGAWGGPAKKIWGLLIAAPTLGLGMLVVGLTTRLPAIVFGVVVFYFGLPVINACATSIWQVKVKPAIQGRVFALLRVVAQLSLPIAFLSAGPLADWLEALMAEGAMLGAGPLGAVLGYGPGRGLGLLLASVGVLLMILGVIAPLIRRLRRVEEDLPDEV